jgi:LAO/AO transport system kinase
VGKSSLISSLVAVCRRRYLRVGVISVDPSSPFTQGAVLGDRIRLSEHFLDQDVFIRSMGTRGHLGGLAAATMQAVLILDAAGKDVIFLETVGVGQSEVEVASVADTVVLALMPGSGDSIQALKAGVMEIPDVLVVNKKDHPSAEITLGEVRGILALDDSRGTWATPLLATNAHSGEGVEELWDQIRAHGDYLRAEGLFDQRRALHLERGVVALATREMESWLLRQAGSDVRLTAILERVRRLELDPLSAVRAIMTEVFAIPETEL